MKVPRLRIDEGMLPGFIAVILFSLMALIVLNANFGTATGFPDGINITAEIGYALLDLTALQSTDGAIGETERFLVAFILIAVVLDAALDAALMLARRESADDVVTIGPVAETDGGSDDTSAGGDDR